MVHSAERALLPTWAFAVGLWRGARRAWADPVGPDTPLLLLTALTLAGYVAFTFGNPWFAAVKASYLLGLKADPQTTHGWSSSIS